MRILTLLLISFLSVSIFAQDQAYNPNASVGFHVSKGAIGAFGEYYLKPTMSVWLSAGARISSVQLGYGVDTSINIPDFPVTTEKLSNAQTTGAIRSGVRFYVPIFNEKWTFSYSPFGGYSFRTAPSDEYTAGLARQDINPSYLRYPLQPEERYAELGGEIGLRWRFFRSFFVEGSALGMYKLSLLDNDHEPDLDLAFVLGYTF